MGMAYCSFLPVRLIDPPEHPGGNHFNVTREGGYVVFFGHVQNSHTDVKSAVRVEYLIVK